MKVATGQKAEVGPRLLGFAEKVAANDPSLAALASPPNEGANASLVL